MCYTSHWVNRLKQGGMNTGRYSMATWKIKRSVISGGPAKLARHLEMIVFKIWLNGGFSAKSVRIGEVDRVKGSDPFLHSEKLDIINQLGKMKIYI